MLVTTQLQLKRALKNAGSYPEWREAAVAYVRHRGLDRWRRRDHSRQYDYVSIRTRLDRLRSLKARQDQRGLLPTVMSGSSGGAIVGSTDYHLDRYAVLMAD